MTEYELQELGLSELLYVQHLDNMPFKVKNNGASIPVSTYDIIGESKEISYIGRAKTVRLKILFIKNVSVAYKFCTNYTTYGYGHEIR